MEKNHVVVVSWYVPVDSDDRVLVGMFTEEEANDWVEEFHKQGVAVDQVAVVELRRLTPQQVAAEVARHSI